MPHYHRKNQQQAQTCGGIMHMQEFWPVLIMHIVAYDTGL